MQRLSPENNSPLGQADQGEQSAPSVLLSEAIDLSGHGIYHAPHLLKPAVLQLGDESVFILPEVDIRRISDVDVPGFEPIVRKNGDYTIIAATGLQIYMDDNVNNQDLFRRVLPLVDRAYDVNHNMPSGMTIVHNGELVQLGRKASPLMLFGKGVDDLHAEIKVTNDGLSIADYSFHQLGTWLYLSAEDDIRMREQSSEQPVNPDLRNNIFAALNGLTENGEYQYDDNGLDIKIRSEKMAEESRKVLILEIFRAVDYPDLKPADNHVLKRLTVDPTIDGISVFDLPSTQERKPGIYNITRHSQLNTQQAEQLIHLVSKLYSET
jgi:hypothetical protein